jgi:hypothetical protein
MLHIITTSGWFDGKGARLHFKGQRIKFHQWYYVVNNGMFIEYSLMEFQE